jgi:post-GPI attachment to proteins factor 3
MLYNFILIILNLIFTSNVNASRGDQHYIYRACLNHCQQINCSTPLGLNEFRKQQTFFEYIFQWSCPNECSYQCMWKTVYQMQSNGQPVVQFHGKHQ